MKNEDAPVPVLIPDVKGLRAVETRPIPHVAIRFNGKNSKLIADMVNSIVRKKLIRAGGSYLTAFLEDGTARVRRGEWIVVWADPKRTSEWVGCFSDEGFHYQFQLV